MPNWKISYSERKDQCCPPSSYRQVNTVIVEAVDQESAVAQLKGKNIEVKEIN